MSRVTAGDETSSLLETLGTAAPEASPSVLRRLAGVETLSPAGASGVGRFEVDMVCGAVSRLVEGFAAVNKRCWAAALLYGESSEDRKDTTWTQGRRRIRRSRVELGPLALLLLRKVCSKGFSNQPNDEYYSRNNNESTKNSTSSTSTRLSPPPVESTCPPSPPCPTHTTHPSPPQRFHPSSPPPPTSYHSPSTP